MNKAIDIVKYCPDCGGALVERTNSKNGSTFLGCTNYPECRHTEPVPESVKMRRAGQRDMFDILGEPQGKAFSLGDLGGLNEGYKRIYADDLAAGLGFAWNYESADDYDLYEALEAMGYEWDGENWRPA